MLGQPGRQRSSVRRDVITLCVIFCALGVAGGFYASAQANNRVQASQHQVALDDAASAAQQLESQVQSYVDIVKSESQSPDTLRMLGAPSSSVGVPIGATGTPGHADLLSTDGADVATSLGHIDAGYPHSAWLSDARTHLIVAGPVLDPAIGRSVVVFAGPIRTSGVFAMFVEDNTLIQALVAVDRNGHILSQVVPSGAGRTAVATASTMHNGLVALHSAGSGHNDHRPSSTGVGQLTILGVSIFQRYLGWQVSVSLAASKALSDAQGAHDQSVFLILLCLLVAVLGTLIVYRRVTSPIRRLEQAVLTAAQSHQSVRGLEAKGPVEIVALGTSIGSLVSEVQRDLSDGRAAESVARESEQAYRSLFEANRMPMWVYDTETTAFLAANAAAEALYGFSAEEFLDMTLADIGVDATAVERQLADPMSLTLERIGPLSNRTKSGRMVHVYLTSSPLNFKGRVARFVVAEELARRATDQPQLERSLRLESIGERASSVAHDFNHILGIISAYTEFVKEAIRPAEVAVRPDDAINWSNVSADVGTIERAVHRGAELTDRLLAFVRQEDPVPQLLNVEDAIDEIGGLLGRSFGEDIHLTTRISPDLWPVYFDRDHLIQALFNLAVNARDAMEGGGDLTFTAENAPGTQGHIDRVIIRVSDTGAGMDPETQRRIFEPFFTTKGRGVGTGLGLASVAATVTCGGGTVGLDSALGLGTTVTIALPRCAVSADVPPAHDDDFFGSDVPGPARPRSTAEMVASANAPEHSDDEDGAGRATPTVSLPQLVGASRDRP